MRYLDKTLPLPPHPSSTSSSPHSSHRCHCPHCRSWSIHLSTVWKHGEFSKHQRVAWFLRSGQWALNSFFSPLKLTALTTTSTETQQHRITGLLPLSRVWRVRRREAWSPAFPSSHPPTLTLTLNHQHSHQHEHSRGAGQGHPLPLSRVWRVSGGGSAPSWAPHLDWSRAYCAANLYRHFRTVGSRQFLKK